MKSTQKKPLSLMMIFCFSLFLLQGCASKYGPQTTNVAYYPMCYQPVAQLRQEESSVNDSTASGAAVGAILGAIVGGLATGKVEGAAAGAVVGGVAGAISGHAYASAKNKNKEREFFAQYASQLNQETAHMDRTTAAAKIAANCYDKEFKNVVAMAKAGRISKIELTNRYEEIRAGLQETSRILKTNYTDTLTKEQEYRKIMAEETKVYDPVYATHVQKEEPVTPKSQAPVKKKPRTVYKAPASAAPEVKQAAASTSNWQASRDDMEETQLHLDEQIAHNEEILLAALES